MAVPTNYNNDLGQQEINELIDRIELELYREYERAAAQMQGKLRKYLNQFDEEDEIMRKKLEAGEITEKEFKDWRRRKIINTRRWVEMRNVLARDAVNADTIALSIIKGHLPSAYAIGHNYGTYMIESGVGIDTSYTLYDRQTVERLVREHPKLMPDPSPNGETARKLRENKDLVWNADHIQGQVVQGILQGEPLKDVAKRMQNVTDMDDRAAKRNAATMMTSAQNGGRIDSFKRAENMGIQLKKVWLATLDNHTREAHRDLDGQEQPTDEPFKSELGDIMFPGDPNADPANVWNCRCTLITQLKGFERDITDLGLRHDDNLKGMSYDEWKNAHGVDNLADSSIINVTNTVITDEAIANVPDINVTGLQELNQKHLEASQDLLRNVRTIPEGHEMSIIYDANMDRISGHGYVTGLEGEVKIDSYSDKYHAFHNHPSSQSFSFSDIFNMSCHNNMLSLTAQGNNGNKYVMIRSNNCDNLAYKTFLFNKGKEVLYNYKGANISLEFIHNKSNKTFIKNMTSNMSKEDLQKFHNATRKKTDECIMGGAKYGFIYKYKIA